jgi:hypothetical protein
LEALPYLQGQVAHKGRVWLGMRLKSGQMTSLKMCCSAAMVSGNACRRSGSARRGHRIQHHGSAAIYLQVRMGEEDVVHRLHFIQGEVIAHTRTCVDEDAPVDQERGGAAVPRDGARTIEHA